MSGSPGSLQPDYMLNWIDEFQLKLSSLNPLLEFCFKAACAINIHLAMISLIPQILLADRRATSRRSISPPPVVLHRRPR